MLHAAAQSGGTAFSTLRESRGCETTFLNDTGLMPFLFQYSPRVEGV